MTCSLPRMILSSMTLAGMLLGLASCGNDSSSTPAAGGGGAAPAGKMKIGFLVKQPDEPWFQIEWKFAQKAADECGFDLQKIGATDGEKTLTAIDSLAAAGAKAFVICAPDTRLGPAIMAKANGYGLKVVTVDDRFIGPDGKPMEEVKYLGISPRDIGSQAGEVALAEMKKRGWKTEETACCVSSFEELDTSKQRTDGGKDALVAGGFPKDKLYNAPNKTSDTTGSFDAANICLTQHPEVKHWLILGMNDSAVLGAVRAMEGRGFGAGDVIGVGINGTDCIPEFKKPAATGFYGSLLLSPKRHGYDTAKMAFEWAKDGKEPPATTLIKTAILITRDNWQQTLKEQGLAD